MFSIKRLNKHGVDKLYSENNFVANTEEAVSDLEGIEKVTSKAGEGSGTVTVEMIEGEDIQRLAQDIKAEVDRISSFPEEAEEPRVTIASRKRYVVSLALYGDQSEQVLREYAEVVRAAREAGLTNLDLQGYPG